MFGPLDELKGVLFKTYLDRDFTSQRLQRHSGHRNLLQEQEHLHQVSIAAHWCRTTPTGTGLNLSFAEDEGHQKLGYSQKAGFISHPLPARRSCGGQKCCRNLQRCPRIFQVSLLGR